MLVNVYLWQACDVGDRLEMSVTDSNITKSHQHNESDTNIFKFDLVTIIYSPTSLFSFLSLSPLESTSLYPFSSLWRYMLRLTAQMRKEFRSMDARIGVLYKLAHSNYPISFFRVTGLHREELKAYKIKLEILFSDTDNKEQSKMIRGCNPYTL